MPASDSARNLALFPVGVTKSETVGLCSGSYGSLGIDLLSRAFRIESLSNEQQSGATLQRSEAAQGIAAQKSIRRGKARQAYVKGFDMSLSVA